MAEESDLKLKMLDAMKIAMKAKQKDRLTTIRMALAAIKQREVDERISLTDDDVIAIVNKMIKQRRDSIQQFEKAGRDELAQKEREEITVLEEYLPEALSEEEIGQIIDSAITEVSASSMKDMGKVMGIIRPKMMGKADMSVVSKVVKEKLA
ncbi:MAG: GatB/YqeY domain-containing protein [Methylococcales bacterium]|jgi:uncharacterized protein YqeY|nr:GatB/YqeY domain-containing protein [Methylococcales bacterium]MBT7408066.1 GatB/YqeY domain-containing protein [Methylococcales bacterium]